MALTALLVVVVAMALSTAAGASAYELTCSVDVMGAFTTQGESALWELRRRGDNKYCQMNCDKARCCTLLSKHQTARIKICGFCSDCVPRTIADPLFAGIMDNRRDGPFVSGKVTYKFEDSRFEVVIEGSWEDGVDSGIEMKHSN